MKKALKKIWQISLGDTCITDVQYAAVIKEKLRYG